ncbi:C1 family peptidase [Lactobacillus equicursoris]|uniref:C1 family peptidase n=1 Tax=Lactobacillus equicursoris TaxID=420645 RepID=UPI00242D2538|nr:C1 family peptidase [Lactobacillus equicursoris]MDD6386562.1 C1 family peptidase [Lactobacillus equicursoris]
MTKHELNSELLDQFSRQFNADPKNQVISRAVSRSGLQEAAYNSAAEHNHTFSLELDTDNVTNQKQSGRCWLFSTLNVVRHNFGKKNKAKNFTFSQSYNFFWDKIERANYFYDRIIKTAARPLDDRTVRGYFDWCQTDGGQWHMAASLIKKYGVVPTYAMPESFNSEHSAVLDQILADKERKDALALRELAQKDDQEALEAARVRFLGDIYQIMATALGEPPKTFDLEFRDDNKNYHLDKDLTPLAFYQKYCDTDLDDYVVLANAPDHPLNRVLHLGFEDNIQGGYPNLFINVPMEYLERATVEQLKGGEAVWFGNDVLRQMDRKTGMMDLKLYQYDALLGIDTHLSKADRLRTGIGESSHDMAIVGADIDGGHIRKWKVENSWGDKSGNKGYFTMSADWFREYTYEVAVQKQYVPNDILALLDTDPIELDPWDSLI